MLRPGFLANLLAITCLAAIGPAVARAGVTDLLFVVANPASLTIWESGRKTQFENWGYTVSLIDDGASQAAYNAAVAGKNVAYIPITAAAASVGTKLKNTTIGVVNEHPDLADDFGIASSSHSVELRDYLAIQNNTHYITYGLSLADLTITTSAQNLVRRTGTLAAGAVALANVRRTPGQIGPGLISLEVGAALYGGGSAAGRRVQMPIDTTFNIAALNANGVRLFERAIEWAARPNPSIGNLLFVVASTGSLTAQETARRMQIDVWGYDVTLINDGDTQANYNAAVTANDVVYISEEIVSTTLGTKLTNAAIGIVNEEAELNDEFGVSSSASWLSAAAITINNNNHYITSPFSTGSLTLLTASQSVCAASGTLAPCLQTLGKWGSARGLVVLEKNAALSGGGNAAGRRVGLPWGGGTFDFNRLNSNGKTLMRRAIEWAAAAPGSPLLVVAADADSPSTQEVARFALLESWAYSVILIDDDATQADFNAAVTGVDVAYIPEEVAAASLSAKLAGAAVGVVSEKADLADEMGISTGCAVGTGSLLEITDNQHYITSALSTGTVAIFDSAQPTTAVAGKLASDLLVLAKWGSDKALATLDAGGMLHDGGFVAGRRVQLPWGDGAFDINALNANGRLILQRSLEWAGKLAGHWRLDETTGNVSADSSGKNNHGTLSSGFSFVSDSVSPGKHGNALRFDGAGDYISIPSAASVQPTSGLTISAWIKGDAWGSGTDVDAILRKGEANPNNYQLAVADGRVALFLDDGDGAGFRGDTVLQTGKWYHVAATWDGTNVMIFVDGKPDRTIAGLRAVPIGADSRALYIGGRSGADFFDGVIDDVRLYSYGMRESELKNLKGIGQPKGVRILVWKEVQ